MNQIDLFLTTPDKKNLLGKQPPISWDAKLQSGLPSLTVEASKPQQPFLGVGAALTDSSAWLLAQSMDASERR